MDHCRGVTVGGVSHHRPCLGATRRRGPILGRLLGLCECLPTCASRASRACAERCKTRPSSSPTASETPSQATRPMGTHHHAFMPPPPRVGGTSLDDYCLLTIHNTMALPPRQGSRGHSIGLYVPGSCRAARNLAPASDRPAPAPAVSADIAAAIRNVRGRGTRLRSLVAKRVCDPRVPDATVGSGPRRARRGGREPDNGTPRKTAVPYRL